MVNQKIITIVSIIIVIIFAILAIKAISGDFNQFEFKGFPYIIPDVVYVGDVGFSGYGYDYAGYLLLDHPTPLPYADRFTLSLKSTALSAQNPINVDAKIIFNPDSMSDEFINKYVQKKEFFFIVFPNAYILHPEKSDEKSYHAFITLVPMNNSNVFQGKGTIIYPFEGDFGYLFLSSEDMRNTLDDDGTWDLSASAYRIQNNTIPVESASVTASINSNNILLALAFIGTAFGTIQILHYYSNKK